MHCQLFTALRPAQALPAICIRTLPLLYLLAAALLLSACASKSKSTFYSLEGPPLAIAGEQDGRLFEGSMERTAMLGQGEMLFRQVNDAMGLSTGRAKTTPESAAASLKDAAENTSETLLCHGSIKSIPNENGHYAGGLMCNDGNALMFIFRSLGPDQGVGLGSFIRPAENNALVGGPLVFYFHPWQEEARRRLNQEKNAFLDIIRRGQSQ